MNYNKKLILAIIALASGHTAIQSSQKKPGVFFRVLDHIRPTMQGHMQASHINPLMQQIRHQASRTKYAMEKMYAPFEHPFYTKFIEPLYVGNKSDTWNKQMKEQWQSIMMNAHDKFKLKKYNPWKNMLTEEQKEKYQDEIRAYEKSYFAYTRNPNNLEIHQELLMHTQHLQEIIHQTSPSRQQRIRNMLFDR